MLYRDLSQRNITGWIGPIDGLRAIAVFAVLIHHGNTSTFKEWALGNMAVALFFAISGFVAYYVLYRDEQKLGAISYNYFLFRRILRIWPAYFLLIVVVWLMASPAEREATSEFSTVTFVMNWDAAAHRIAPLNALGILWSIAVEEQFYVLAPLMYLCLRSRRWLLFSIAVFAAANIGRFVYISYLVPKGAGIGTGLYFVTYAYADLFLAGALVARWFVAGNKTTWRRQWCLFIISTLMLFGIMRMWAPILWPPYSIAALLPYALLPLACGALLLSILPLNRTAYSAILSSPPMHFLGTISYGLYLVHVAVLVELMRLIPASDRLGLNVAFIAASIVTATALYALVEWPFLRFKNRAGLRVGYWPQILIWGLLAIGFANILLRA